MIYDIKCPKCGHMNRSLDLIETDGWYECDACMEKQRIREKYLAILLPKPEIRWRKAS